jgi:hypothetical protein
VRNPAFLKLLREIEALHETKNEDYAADADPLSNLRRCEEFNVPAFTGVLVRLTDKWSRITQLAGGKAPRHESLRDSLVDNAVYSLLAVLLLDERAATTATVIPTATICLPDHPISETCTPDLAVPVGPQGWTIRDELKMRP